MNLLFETVHVLRVELKGSKPPIWRKLAVPSDMTLGELHDTIQIAMGWEDDHLHQFRLRIEKKKVSRQQRLKQFREMVEEQSRRIAQGGDVLGGGHFFRMRGERIFASRFNLMGQPMDLEGEDEDAVTLAEVCPKVKDKLIYEYDFGDKWRHTIAVQKIVDREPGKTYPRCLGGKMACPPEDCGGIWGYYGMLDALDDPTNERREEILDWLGDDFDPEAFDPDEVNRRLDA
jgi:hypothetical protein